MRVIMRHGWAMACVHACWLQHKRGNVQVREEADDSAASSTEEASPHSDQVVNRDPLQEEEDEHTLQHETNTDEDGQGAEVDAAIDTVDDAPAAKSACFVVQRIKTDTRV